MTAGLARASSRSVVPAAAAIAFVLFEVLRVWLPSVLFIVGDAGSTPAPILGAFALGCLLLPVLAAAFLPVVGVQALWWTGGLLLAAGRLALVATDGGTPQAVAATVAVVGGGVAVAAMAARTDTGRATRTAVLAGFAANAVAHVALRGHDLVWRDGTGAIVASAGVVGILVIAVVTGRGPRHTAEVPAADGLRNGSTGGPAWPWLVLAPMLVLIGILTGPPGRLDVATGWPASVIAASVTAVHLAAILAAAVAPRLGAMRAGWFGSGLVLVGTAGALPAAGLPAVIGQALIAVGLGLLVGMNTGPTRVVSARRRGLVAAGAVLLFGVLTFLYYASYDISLPFNNRIVLLVAAGMAAAIGVAGARTTIPLDIGPTLDAGGLVRAGTGAAALVAIVAVVGAITVPAGATHGVSGQPVRAVLYNIHFGFDPDGRFSVDEQAAVLRALEPDIVVLNEVDRGWLTTGGIDTLRLLATALDLPYLFAPAADEVWGNALLSRYPVTEFVTERLPRGADPMTRSQFGALLEPAPGQQIAVVGTHLSHGDDRAGTRIPQARAVAGTVARYRERGIPTAVLGDLNAGPSDPELAAFAALSVVSAVGEGTFTYPSWSPTEQIDHVLLSPDLRATDVTVPDVQASDHLPVAVTIEFRP